MPSGPMNRPPAFAAAAALVPRRSGAACRIALRRARCAPLRAARRLAVRVVVVRGCASSGGGDGEVEVQVVEAVNAVAGGGGGEGEGVAARVGAALRAALAPGGFLWGVFAGLAVAAVVVFAPWDAVLGKNGAAELAARAVREKVFLYDVILQDISAGYVDNVDVDKLFTASVQGMLGVLDPYSQFESREEALEMGIRTSGKFGGVGLGIGVGEVLDEGRRGLLGDGKGIVVVSAFEGYAWASGVRPGDVISSIDGVPTRGMEIKDVSERLRGEPGTSVSVNVLREGAGELAFVLQRQRVAIRDVPVSALVGEPRDRMGYVRLQSFAKDAAEEVSAAIQALQGEAGDGGLRGLVLDLRGNPGGLLDSAIKVAEALVPKGSVVVSTRGRGAGPGPVYLSNSDPVVAPDLPIAVLVNGQSASASEVVAGAVQDLDVGIVVGTRSYGKGLVQQLLSLPFQTALKYTSGRYFTPSGRCIQALSYADKDGDGAYEARAVPDADRKEFLTRRGRIVRDGGGIEPDVISTHRSSFLEAALASQNMFFHFASRYAADRHLAALPPNFAVDDALYRDFVRFAAASDFKYESRFDEAFSSLDDMFSEVGYDAARSKVDALRAATLAEMRADFTRHETSIRAQVESAVRFRLQPESARLTAELAHDDQLADAVRLLRSPAEYRGLLAPRPAIAAVSDAPVADATAADAAAAAAAAGRASDTASGAPASASARPSPLHGARPHAPVARPVYAA